MTSKLPFRHGQRGAVAVMVAISMVVFIGFLGIVIDLGNLYIRKTELQNAADAAALAGAKRLDGTDTGITNAANDAKAMALLNASDFDKTAVAIENANIEFADDPDGPWFTVADSVNAPLNKRFIKVDTTNILQGTRPTWFMKAISATHANTTATALAVAGVPICENLPMFVCAPDPTQGAAGNWGFVVGKGYKLAEGPGSGGPGPGNVGYMDPAPPGAPSLINGADQMRDIMCRGKTFCIAAPGPFSSLTQPAFGTMAKALNTRFDNYSGLPASLTPEACPPDTNIRQYVFNDNTSGTLSWTPSANAPEVQGVLPWPPSSTRSAHWAGIRPVNTAAADPPVMIGPYPDESGTPYSQTSGTYFLAPSTAHRPLSQPNRRIITMGLATNCLDASGNPQINGSGKPVTVPAFAQFLMPVEAVGTGSDKGIYAEFIRLAPTPPSSIPDIKLYR